jgi:hypothetical protein
LFNKTASENVISTGGFLKQLASANVTTDSEKTDFHWSLALAALKNAVQIALGPLL